MKITRAMELIATSRIARARVRVAQAQPYTDKMNEVIRNLGAGSGGASHPLLERRDVRRAGVVVVSSDRGLAGGYNSNVIRMAEHRIRELQDERKHVHLYTVGEKARGYFAYRRFDIEHAWLGVTDTPGYSDARMIGNALLDAYESEAVDSVEVFTTRYVSALTQRPEQWPILPIEPPDAQGNLPIVGYTYEPSPEDILARLLPRYLEGTIFGILLEASASEHAARRRAMKAATENAEELVRVLTREANQARQAEITTEISEIVGGAEALAGGR
jgi:F-type H+-transporting ATPase subunit gamma